MAAVDTFTLKIKNRVCCIYYKLFFLIIIINNVNKKEDSCTHKDKVHSLAISKNMMITQ